MKFLTFLKVFSRRPIHITCGLLYSFKEEFKQEIQNFSNFTKDIQQAKTNVYALFYFLCFSHYFFAHLFKYYSWFSTTILSQPVKRRRSSYGMESELFWQLAEWTSAPLPPVGRTAHYSGNKNVCPPWIWHIAANQWVLCSTWKTYTQLQTAGWNTICSRKPRLQAKFPYSRRVRTFFLILF